jgi:hypothetical protein
MIGWPLAWLEWDVLFLIPWVWLGPWVCPALIALLFIVWGFRVLSASGDFRFSRRQATTFLFGAVLGLATFLWPAGAVLFRDGLAGLIMYAPGEFPWPFYFIALISMALGLPWRQWRLFGC